MASSSCICGGYSELCSHQIILCGFMKFANHSILFLFAFYTGSQLFENLGCSCHRTACKFSVLVMPLSWEWSFLHTAKINNNNKMLMPSSTEIWIWTPRLCSKRKKMQCKNQIQITNAGLPETLRDFSVGYRCLEMWNKDFVELVQLLTETHRQQNETFCLKFKFKFGKENAGLLGSLIQKSCMD